MIKQTSSHPPAVRHKLFTRERKGDDTHFPAKKQIPMMPPNVAIMIPVIVLFSIESTARTEERERETYSMTIKSGPLSKPGGRTPLPAF